MYVCNCLVLLPTMCKTIRNAKRSERRICLLKCNKSGLSLVINLKNQWCVTIFLHIPYISFSYTKHVINKPLVYDVTPASWQLSQDLVWLAGCAFVLIFHMPYMYETILEIIATTNRTMQSSIPVQLQ